MRRTFGQRLKQRETLLCIGVFLLSLIASLLYTAGLPLSPQDQVAGDSKFYHRAGQGVARILSDPGHYVPALIKGEVTPEEVRDLGLENKYDSGLLRSPAYGLFLGVVYALGGDDMRTAVTVQCVMLAAAIALIFLLGRRLFGTGTGLLAALLACGYSSHWLYTARILTELPTLFALVLSSYCLVAWVQTRSFRWLRKVLFRSGEVTSRSTR